jgi:hypothetical protein
MGVLIVILEVLIAGYSMTLLFYLLFLVKRKKRLPRAPLMANMVCILFFLFVQKMVEEHKFVFTGQYSKDTENWGSGLANVGYYITNHTILVANFLVTQLIFWVWFLYRFKKLNKVDEESGSLLQ